MQRRPCDGYNTCCTSSFKFMEMMALRVYKVPYPALHCHHAFLVLEVQRLHRRLVPALTIAIGHVVVRIRVAVSQFYRHVKEKGIRVANSNG